MDVLTFGEALACFSPALDRVEAARGLYARTVGGAEANTAIGLARLGHDVAWVSRVARDPLGEHVLATLGAEGVDVSHTIRDAERQTGTMIKERIRPHDTSVHYYRRDSAATRLAPGDISDELLGSARILHFTGVTLAIGEHPRRLAHETAARAQALGTEVSFDANFRPRLIDADEAQRAYLHLIPHVTHLLCNEIEAQIMTGLDDVDDAVTALRDLGPENVIVKRGIDGAIADVDGVRHVIRAAPAPHPIDTVGAGDAFNAGWLHSRLIGLPTDRGLDLAAFVAAAVVQHPGDYEGFPSAATVAAWLDNTANDESERP